MARVQRVEAPRQPTLTKTADDTTKPRALPKGLKPRFSSFTSVTSHKIEVQGNQVQVMASLSMRSNYPAIVHLWHVMIRRESDGVLVVDHPDVDQQFEIDPSGKMSPKFVDAVELPSGKYRGVLRLYGLNKGTNFINLTDEEKERVGRLIEIPKVVEIP